MFASKHGSYGGIIQKKSSDRKQDDFPCLQKSKACCGVFDDEDGGWVQIGNQGEKINSVLET